MVSWRGLRIPARAGNLLNLALVVPQIPGRRMNVNQQLSWVGMYAGIMVHLESCEPDEDAACEEDEGDDEPNDAPD